MWQEIKARLYWMSPTMIFDFDVEGRQLIERGQYTTKTRLSALQLVAKGTADNEDAWTALLVLVLVCIPRVCWVKGVDYYIFFYFTVSN